ncbi:MAG: helix-turn-helix transcriptional regulator [Lentisphaeria bacterium]|nr:helix-turn-helix transcriptional regulator [Lentisphaeria bacterium]
MEMKVHVNGWRTIERQLLQLDRRQGELAQLLKITPAAVSQVKKGVFLLNPKQLEKIAAYLQFDDEMRNEFYTELFNARLLGRETVRMRDAGRYRVCLDRQISRDSREREIPLADLSLLSGYEMQLESMASYLLRNSPERCRGMLRGTGVCALRVDEKQTDTGLAPGSVILLESGRYPEPGALNLIALRNGEFQLREFVPDGGRIILRPALRNSGEDITLERREISDYLLWLHPVLEITLRFRC